MKCLEVREQLTAYLDDEITSSERALVESHLAGCGPCRRSLASLSETRKRLKTFLSVRAGQSSPAAQDWNQLQMNAEKSAASKIARFSTPGEPHWPVQQAPVGNRVSKPTQQGTLPMNKKILTAFTGLAALAVVIFVMARNVTTVSAQQILERASEAQTAAESISGIWHLVIEDYQNPNALNGEESGTLSVSESYSFVGNVPDAPEAGTVGRYYRTVTRDADGALIDVFSMDENFTYSSYGPNGNEMKDGVQTIYRTPLDQDGRKKIEASDITASTRAIFEQFRNNPRVTVEGKITLNDGREAYVLVDDNYQTRNLPDGSVDRTLVGSMKMVFDAGSYELLESTLTIRKDDRDIILNSVKFTVNEVLPADTEVAWDLSDFKEFTVVDQSFEVQTGADVTFETMTEEELTSKIKTYLLEPMPDGFSREIVAVPGQEVNEEYRYETNYTGPAGENFDMQAVGLMDPAFVQSSFYDGSYKAASGLVLYYSSSSNETHTSGMLITPEGQGFLLFSSLPREQVEALVDTLTPTK